MKGNLYFVRVNTGLKVYCACRSTEICSKCPNRAFINSERKDVGVLVIHDKAPRIVVTKAMYGIRGSRGNR